MFKRLERLFNWKKYPGSVFYIALPLATVAFMLLFARAILELKIHGDPWFLVIAACGVGLLVFALWPLRKEIMKHL